MKTVDYYRARILAAWYEGTVPHGVSFSELLANFEYALRKEFGDNSPDTGTKEPEAEKNPLP